MHRAAVHALEDESILPIANEVPQHLRDLGRQIHNALSGGCLGCVQRTVPRFHTACDMGREPSTKCGTSIPVASKSASHPQQAWHKKPPSWRSARAMMLCTSLAVYAGVRWSARSTLGRSMNSRFHLRGYSCSPSSPIALATTAETTPKCRLSCGG